jgi:type IV pilus assembly protein PilA
MLAAGRPKVKSLEPALAVDAWFGASSRTPDKGESMRKTISMRRMRGNYYLGPSFVLGILAAIAIPAYHDYTLRVRVTQGLNLAAAVKASVAEFYATQGKWPRDLRELQFESAPRGQWVNFVAVNRGTVVIRYAQSAGPQLSRHQVTLRPTVTAEGNVLWGCGYTASPGMDPETGAASELPTDIHPKYLPSVCRGG